MKMAANINIANCHNMARKDLDVRPFSDTGVLTHMTRTFPARTQNANLRGQAITQQREGRTYRGNNKADSQDRTLSA
jgi:hypothetical protein